MAFVIKNIVWTKKVTQPYDIVLALCKVLDKSRFIVELTHDLKKISIGKVRLKVAKDYCGNHPLPCPVRTFHRPHKVMTYLEGSDWVAFNDMLNDVLDKMNVSANVASSNVIIRKGSRRCISYASRPQGNGNEWVKDSGEFQDRLGMFSPRSEYPNGTPGIPEYLINKAKGYQIPDHDHH